MTQLKKIKSLAGREAIDFLDAFQCFQRDCPIEAERASRNRQILLNGCEAIIAPVDWDCVRHAAHDEVQRKAIAFHDLRTMGTGGS